MENVLTRKSSIVVCCARWCIFACTLFCVSASVVVWCVTERKRKKEKQEKHICMNMGIVVADTPLTGDVMFDELA